MTPFEKLLETIKKTEVIKPPRQPLSTFGQTEIEYFLVSDLVQFPDRCRLRYGDLIAKKPMIISPETMMERFEGFGLEGKKYGDWFLKSFGDELRGLQYKFTNDLRGSRLERASPHELIDRINSRLDFDSTRPVTILKGPDESWQLSLLKFIVEMSARSFHGNLQELNERGFFDPDTRVGYQRVSEIEKLMKKAGVDRSLLPLLGKKLKEYGLFEQYQDRFFSLVGRER